MPDASSSYRQTVSDIRPGVRFSGPLLVRESKLLTTANGKPFVDLRLSDKTGIVPAKIWDPPRDKQPPAPGTLIQVEGKGDEYNGHIQLKIDSLSAVPADAGYPLEEFVVAAPEKPENMLREIRETAEALRDEDYRTLATAFLDAAETTGKLLTAPAAKAMHHAERGGLLHHTVMMLRAAKKLCEVYRFLNKDLLYAGVMVHDLAKLAEMKSDELGAVEGYTRDGKLIGHIIRGVTTIDRLGREKGVPTEKSQLLQHLVLSHHGDPEFGSPVPPLCPEALVLSTIDRLDAHLFAMVDALDKTEPGGFSAPVFALGKIELYRPSVTPPAPEA